MRIIQIIDSLEANGGSTCFLELVSAMRKHWQDYQIDAYVVSKSGEYGREGLVDPALAKSYGVSDIFVHSYEDFVPIAKKIKNAVVLHHVLGHTGRIEFHKSTKYVLVNHALTNIRRLANMQADAIVCVCKYFADHVRVRLNLPVKHILNGCEDYYDTKPSSKSKSFIIGRCQRVVPSKIDKRTLSPTCIPHNCKQIVIGPVSESMLRRASKQLIFPGPIFDRQEKLSMIKSFDLYLHDSGRPEGASMAVLEALSVGVPILCRDKPGGVHEIIKHNHNGYFFDNMMSFRRTLNQLVRSEKKMQALRKAVRSDFLKRLHIVHPLLKYRALIGDLIGSK